MIQNGVDNMRIINRDTRCGIYDTAYTAAIYPDRVELRMPYIKWVNNSGILAILTEVIKDPKIVTACHTALGGRYPETDQYGDAHDGAEDFILRLLLDHVI